MPMRPAPGGPVVARIFFLATTASLLCLPACSIPPEEQGFASSSPQARARALGVAVADDDQAAIPNLITMLGSDDPAQRMLAIRALEQMTGQTLGYQHDAPEPSRQEAIRAWVAWWDSARKQPAQASSVAPAAAMADHQSAGTTSQPPAGPRSADPSR